MSKCQLISFLLLNCVLLSQQAIVPADQFAEMQNTMKMLVNRIEELERTAAKKMDSITIEAALKTWVEAEIAKLPTQEAVDKLERRIDDDIMALESSVQEIEEERIKPLEGKQTMQQALLSGLENVVSKTATKEEVRELETNLDGQIGTLTGTQEGHLNDIIEIKASLEALKKP